jgi:DUF4097 and DUF4098 domain-containing protein YvlB
VRVPATVVAVEAYTMNGAITARSSAAELSLHTMNGPVDATGSAAITAETMNGAVVARATSKSPVELSTKNGSVELVLPPDGSADVEASTVNGHVTSEFGPVPAPAIPRLQDVRLRVGSGGPRVSLKTLNGNVAVRRGG